MRGWQSLLPVAACQQPPARCLLTLPTVLWPQLKVRVFAACAATHMASFCKWGQDADAASSYRSPSCFPGGPALLCMSSSLLLSLLLMPEQCRSFSSALVSADESPYNVYPTMQAFPSRRRQPCPGHLSAGQPPPPRCQWRLHRRPRPRRPLPCSSRSRTRRWLPSRPCRGCPACPA